MNSETDVIVCCHNSARRLPATLQHLARQTDIPADSWAVLVVDNGSTDDTSTTARAVWEEELRAPVPLTVVREDELGLAHARQAGIRASKRPLICFVDDDNWLADNWLATMRQVFESDERIGAVGGATTAVFDSPAPAWFLSASRSFAVGRQAQASCDVTEARGYVWGAGLGLRRDAIESLFDRGYRFASTGRTGSALGSGDDQELCLALRLAGWRIYYDERLTLQHFMPKGRLAWSYAKRLTYGHGYSEPELACFREAFPGHAPLYKHRSSFGRSADAAVRLAKIVIRQPRLLWSKEATALTVRSIYGRAVGYATKARRVAELRRSIANAEWNIYR